MDYYLKKETWDKIIPELNKEYLIYAPVSEGTTIDYEPLQNNFSSTINYNIPRRITPLKLFFLPIAENVTKKNLNYDKRIIIGVPNCDLAGLTLLDRIFLSEPFVDEVYKLHREKTLLIGTDCYDFLENCHCTAYGLKPYPEANHDIALAILDNSVFLKINSTKGETFFKILKELTFLYKTDRKDIERIKKIRIFSAERLKKHTKGLASLQEIKTLLSKLDQKEWERFSESCVACGACSLICPTCSCFTLIDRPGFDFEKVRYIDSCQYPGFAKVAAGENPLKDYTSKFKNRYMCKFIWKPERYNTIACTGCGRCIDACIGKLNKNKFIEELIIHSN